MIRRAFCLSLMLAFSLLPGCDWMPGKPQLYQKWKSPSQDKDFTSLYSQNCMACHSIGKGMPGSTDKSESLAPSLPLDNPVYLSLIPQETMRTVIANGIPGTSMPAFAQSHGGELNDQQVDILVSALYSNKKVANGNQQPPLPPYSAPLGDVARGAQVYSIYCASCHGADGKGGPKGGSVVNPAYLDLVSDQYLRTITIVGRPDLGMPDWKTYAPGKIMSNQDISDVVAWLASHRLKPGVSARPVTQPPPSTTAP